MKVAFFVGSDITAHLIAMLSTEKLLSAGHKVYLFYPNLSHNKKQIAPLRELFFYERTIWHEYIFPQLKQGAPQHISQKAFVSKIYNVNDPHILKFIEHEEVEVGISIRWYQKFSDDLIHYFEGQGVNQFVNLHPGLLPQYRGVFTFSHAMRNQEKEAGFTLHSMDSSWDAGPLLIKASATLDYTKSVLENMLDQTQLAANILEDYFQKQPHSIQSSTQEDESAGYYTHLTQPEIDQLSQQNIKLVDGSQMVERILCQYWKIDPNLIYIPSFTI